MDHEHGSRPTPPPGRPGDRRPEAVTRPGGSLPSHLAERYGDASPPWHRTLARTGAVVAGAVALAWVVWAGIGLGDRDVVHDDVGFAVLSSSEVRVTFDVTKDEDATVRCRLEALNAQYAVVGVADVEVGPASSRTVRTTTVVATQERAVTGLVESCATT
ncbi:DUF4307 domain-containing protein [Thalassiella azotivora]